MTCRTGEKGSCGWFQAALLCPLCEWSIFWAPGSLVQGSEADGSCQAGDWITLVSGLAFRTQKSGFQKPLSIYKRTKLFRL